MRVCVGVIGVIGGHLKQTQSKDKGNCVLDGKDDTTILIACHEPYNQYRRIEDGQDNAELQQWI